MGDLKLKLQHGLLSGLLVCSGSVWAQNSVLTTEAASRAAEAKDAYALVEEGDIAYLEGDFGTALERYSSALANLPDGAPAVAGLRAMAVQRFSQTALVRAQKLMRAGDKEAAGELMNQVEGVDPDNPKVKEFRAKMDDPIRYNPALTPEHAANVDRVRRLLYEAQGYYDQGLFDRAYMTYEDILRIDKYNKAARRGMERVAATKSDSSRSAYDQARAEALSQVAGQWEQKVPKKLDVPIVGEFGPGVAEADRFNIQEKLSTIMVPELRLNGATLTEAIDFLRVLSESQDQTTLDENRKGVPFVIQLGDEDHPAVQKVRAARINLTLDNVPLEEAVRRITDASHTQYRVDDFAVVLNALGFDDPTMMRREFRVPPDFLTGGTVNQQDAADDPFAANPNRAGLVAKTITAKEKLQSYDVNFPEGATANYNKSSNTLLVFNTASNLRLVEAIVAELAKTEPLGVTIRTTIIDVSQTSLEDLGFDLKTGQLKVGSNGILAGGTTGTGTQINDMISGPPVTAGNRSGQLVPTTDGLDALLARETPPTATGTFSSDGTTGTSTSDIRLPAPGDNSASRAPGILSLRGVIDDTVFELLMRGLSQKKSSDIMVRPEVVTRPGQNATVESVIEFPYPEDFEPPQLPNAVLGGGSVVTPATPTDFTYRDLGVSLEVLPQVGPNREVIEVAVNPVLTDFEGFVNYGTPIAGSTSNTNINLVDGTVSGSSVFGELTPNAILKPLFRTIRGKTSVRILDGQTIVIGGLVEEIRKHINDQVPILGDIPIIGRLFQQDAISVEKRSILIFVKVELTDPAGNLYRNR